MNLIMKGSPRILNTPPLTKASFLLLLSEGYREGKALPLSITVMFWGPLEEGAVTRKKWARGRKWMQRTSLEKAVARKTVIKEKRVRLVLKLD